MNQEAKEYIINKYGEETYNGVIDGTIFINDKTLNEMMPKRKFNVEVGKLPKEKVEDIIKKWQKIFPNNLTLVDIPDIMKSDLVQTIPDDNEKIDYYRWNFNHEVGDVVKFADGGFDDWNEHHCWKTLKPELATKNGTVIGCYCDLHAYAYGSAWSCKVDFDGEIVETLCGFFEKV
jgi:hypothetical protein